MCAYSYAVTEYRNKGKTDEKEREKYEESLKFEKFFYFLRAPVLVFQLNYPRNKEFRTGYFIKKCLQTIFHLVINKFSTPWIDRGIWDIRLVDETSVEENRRDFAWFGVYTVDMSYWLYQLQWFSRRVWRNNELLRWNGKIRRQIVLFGTSMEITNRISGTRLILMIGAEGGIGQCMNSWRNTSIPTLSTITGYKMNLILWIVHTS